MIRRVVDFALNNRVLILAMAVLLFIWGIIFVQKSSGRSLSRRRQQLRSGDHAVARARAAEEVEQQVTVPLEIVDERHPST